MKLVEDQAALVDAHDRKRVVREAVAMPELEHIEDARPCDASHDRYHGEVEDLVGRQLRVALSPEHRQDRGQIAQGHHYSIPVDFQGAEMEGYLMHRHTLAQALRETILPPETGKFNAGA
jgi:hypothetical protein